MVYSYNLWLSKNIVSAKLCIASWVENCHPTRARGFVTSTAPISAFGRHAVAGAYPFN